MIKQALLKKHHPEVEGAIIEAFELGLKSQKNPGDFLLFLENGHKRDFPAEGLSDYMIGFGLKGIADADRQDFINFYYNQFKFEEIYKKLKTKDQKEYLYKNSLHFDLMIYTHSWESFPNLSRLKQLANLVTNSSYNWDIKIPDFTRHDFIRKEVRDVFKSKRLKLSEILTRSFHSQLRNAFAHSDYNFFKTDFISLTNYKGDDSWEMREISYADWDERFTLTILLFNLLARKINDYKLKLGSACPPTGYPVWIPTKNGASSKLDHVWYDKHYNRFLWEYQRNRGDQA
jgi:hypothetical protein